MTIKTKHHGKRHFCQYGSQCFSSPKVLECQTKNGLAINNTKSVLFPEESQYVNFQNFKRLIKAAFIIYGDSEWFLIPSTNKIDFAPNTKKYCLQLWLQINMC